MLEQVSIDTSTWTSILALRPRREPHPIQRDAFLEILGHLSRSIHVISSEFGSPHYAGPYRRAFEDMDRGDFKRARALMRDEIRYVKRQLDDGEFPPDEWMRRVASLVPVAKELFVANMFPILKENEQYLGNGTILKVVELPEIKYALWT